MGAIPILAFGNENLKYAGVAELEDAAGLSPAEAKNLVGVRVSPPAFLTTVRLYAINNTFAHYQFPLTLVSRLRRKK